MNIYLYIDGVWQGFTAKMNGTVLELVLSIPLNIKAGELLSIPGEIVFNSVQRVYVGFWAESI